MSRVINPDGAGKERTRMTKGVVIAVRELAKRTRPDATARDLAAFIVLALSAISKTIDVSVAAWEKRGYWVKADRFRMEWLWSGQVAEKMHTALLNEDWGRIATLSAQVASKLSKVKVSENHRLGTPWEGAWEKLVSQQEKTKYERRSSP
jgi:hypothetical protein